jgi:hypothetical protein
MSLSFNRCTVATLFALLLIVIAVGHGWNNAAVAQAPAAAGSVLRYQISAYAGQTAGGGVHHGCYIVDTTTGQVWHTRAGGATEKVPTELR